MNHLTLKKFIPGLCLFLTLLLFSVTARAEESVTTYYDYSTSQAAYAARVAELNRQTEQAQSLDQPLQPEKKKTMKRASQTLTTVLCRTESDMDFSPWNPAYVIAGPDHRYTLYFLGASAAEQAVDELNKTAGIRYAELDTEVCASGVETEEEISFKSWGATRMNYGPYLGYMLPLSQGSVTVAVVDSGVYPHAFYAARMTESGYDYVDADSDATDDPFGHGTNVTGILADCTNGANVFFYPIRVLNSEGGGKASNVANGIREAISRGVQVINLSLESVVQSQTMDEAVRDAVSNGITVVVAAGNKHIDTSTISPAGLTDAGVIVVASAETDGTRSSYSNYGASVDVYAYGTLINCCANTGEYKNATGTSMSAPHISGLAALLLLLHDDLTPAEVEYRITRSTPESEINVPDLKTIIPGSLGFYLQQLPMDPDETITLSTKAHPTTAEESITYEISDPGVLTIEDGVLLPQAPGTATVTASCFGLEPCSFTVSVEPDTGGALQIPAGVIQLENEAFSGSGGFSRVSIPEGTAALGDRIFDTCPALQFVALPESVTAIGDNSFSGAVILCPEGSAAEAYAKEQNLEYILLP